MRMIIATIRRNPAVGLGVLASLLWTFDQALNDTITWEVALPTALAIVIRSVVEPALPGWIARNGIWLGVLASAVIVVAQVLDGTVTVAVIYPTILGAATRAWGAAVDRSPIPPA